MQSACYFIVLILVLSDPQQFGAARVWFVILLHIGNFHITMYYNSFNNDNLHTINCSHNMGTRIIFVLGKSKNVIGAKLVNEVSPKAVSNLTFMNLRIRL